jgi:hypothetical protein
MSSYNQNVQQALDDVAQRYKDVEQWIAELEAKNEDIQNQSQHLENHKGWWIFTWQTVNHDATNAISSDKAAISDLADKIAKADASGGNSPFASLADAIKECANADDGGIGVNASNKTNYVADLTAITTTLTTLIKALNQKVVVAEDEDAIGLLNQNPNGANSSDVSALIQKLIGDEGQESNTLENLSSNLDNALKHYQSQYNDASTDENDIRWYDYLWDGDSRHRTDEANKMNATNLESFIQVVKADIIPEQASLLPDFQQIASMINQILQRLADILNENLSPAEKSQEIMKLSGQIMDLFVIVIGLISLVQQDATKEKSKNEAVMSKATSLASEMGISNTQAQMVKVAQDVAYSQKMKILMTVAKYVLEVAGMIFAPGIGGVLVSALMIVLDAAGVFDLLTKAVEQALEKDGLSPETAKWVADVIVGAMEMAVTMGGGAALDALLKNVMENVMKAIGQEVTEAVTKAVTKAVSEAIDVTVSKMVAPTLKVAAEQAAEQAAKKVFFAMLEKNGLKLLAEWVKELVNDGAGAAERMVQKTMLDAAKDAAERAVQEAAKLISLTGDAGTATADKLIEQISKAAIDAGDAAAAKAMDMSLEDIAKITIREGTLDAIRAAARRGGFTALYAIGSTNLLLDILQDWRKAAKMSEEEYRILLGVATALQAILALIGQLGGTGAAAQFMNGAKSGLSTIFLRIANALTPLASAAEGVASGTQYEIDTNLAETKVTMAKLQTALDVLMQFLSKQIDARRKQESKHDMAEFQEQMKSNFSVASHLYDYLNTSSQVMLQG